MTTHVFTHPVSILLPDGTLYELDLTFTTTRDSITPGTLADASEWEVTDVALCQDNERALRTEGESDSVQVQAEPGLGEAPIELELCEVEYLYLRPNRPYIFRVDTNCKECQRLAAISN